MDTILVNEWLEKHPPDNLETIYAEPDCECGCDERHTHCACCGKLISTGDWDAEPLFVINIVL